MNRTIVKVLVLSALVVSTPAISRAEEKFEDLLKRAQELKDAGKYSQAMTELGWANKQLEKLQSTKLQEVFPASAGGLTGGEFSANNALGMSVIERVYTGPKVKVKATLTGAASSGGAAEGMGMLTGLAGMAAMMGQGPGSDTVRIKGNRGILQTENGNLSLTVPLQSGMMLQIEPEGKGATKEQMIALAEAFNYDSLTALTAKQ